MLRSMTGYGEAQREAAGGLVNVQIRTVNHRGFHTHFRLPLGAERWEADLTAILRESISRGHVHVRLTFQPGPASVAPVEVDYGRLSSYLLALEAIKSRHNLAGDVDLSLITRFNDIFQAPADELERLPFSEVAEAAREALAMVVAMREREGEMLATDLRGSLGEIERALEQIEKHAPQRLVQERDRLRAAVAELSSNVEVDEDRLAREVAFLAERWDINEETVRLRSHLQQFRQLLEADDADAVGKRLGFWVQEMHREANTIGSKANDARIAALAIDIKAAIDKLREQIENVE